MTRRQVKVVRRPIGVVGGLLVVANQRAVEIANERIQIANHFPGGRLGVVQGHHRGAAAGLAPDADLADAREHDVDPAGFTASKIWEGTGQLAGSQTVLAAPDRAVVDALPRDPSQNSTGRPSRGSTTCAPPYSNCTGCASFIHPPAPRPWYPLLGRYS